jgi:hypothetical protein
MTQGRILGAVVAPIAMIAAWLAYLAAAVAGGSDLVFKVEGRDPRDLLRGHYIEYQVIYDIPINVRALGEHTREACVCVAAGEDGIGRGTWFGACHERAPETCPRYIKGRVDYRGFIAGIERFYFPERYRGHLETVPLGATALIRIARNGSAFVRDIRVGEESLIDYARRQADAAELRITPHGRPHERLPE